VISKVMNIKTAKMFTKNAPQQIYECKDSNDYLTVNVSTWWVS